MRALVSFGWTVGLAVALLLSACADGRDLVDVSKMPPPSPRGWPEFPDAGASTPVPGNADARPPVVNDTPIEVVQSSAIGPGMFACYSSTEQQNGEAVINRWEWGGSGQPDPNQTCWKLQPNGRWPNIHNYQWKDNSYMADNLRWVNLFIPKWKCGGIKLYHGVNYTEGHQYNLFWCSDTSGPGDGTLWYANLAPSASSMKTLLYDCPSYPWCPTPPSDW